MIIVTMPAAQLQAWVDAMPKANEHGILSEPLPGCPECQAPADRIDVEGDIWQLAYVAVRPCGHQIMAMHGIEKP